MRKFCREISLAFLNPELAKEWDIDKNYPLTPYDVRRYSGKKVWWKCKKDHEWEANIHNRSHGDGCPYCVGQKVCIDNCLAIKNPNLAKEWNYEKNGGLTPYNVTDHSGKKAWWNCDKGHTYEMVINDRKNTNCSYCSGRIVDKSNCLSTKNPELIKEWNYEKNYPLTPENVFLNNDKKVWWICNRKHNYSATISHRKEGRGCPYCDKIELKDGAICDSLPEAYYYLQLKNKGIKFNYHEKIGLGRHNCDFYIPTENKYIEITGFGKIWKYWKIYLKNIAKKKNHITKNLHAQFEFVQLKLLPKQIQYVRENSL